MPYLKQQKKPYEKMARLLKAYDLNGVKLAQILSCSAPTAKKRIENPALLTLQDLDRINRRVHIPMEEIREAIAP